MAQGTVRWEEMFPDELLRAIETCPVCYLAYGLAEPHGAYNALGLDWLKAYALCEAAARAHGGVVAPPFCWHVQEQPAFDWPKRRGVEQSLSSSIPGDLFLHMVLHQIRAVDARCFRVAVLVTGHYGGLENDMRLLCEYYLRRSNSPLRIRCIADWECIDFGAYRGDHAGMCETQQLMALRAEMVDLDRAEPSPLSGPWAGSPNPSLDFAPTRSEGEAIVASQLRTLGEMQQGLLGGYEEREGWVAPDQNRVEEIWRTFERASRRYWCVSRSWDEYYRGDPKGSPGFPGWDSLGL